MFRNYLKVALRNIFKHKGYSFINIAGLAAGMAAAVLILLFVRYERSYDRFYEKADRIHRVAVRANIGDTKIRQTYTPAILTETFLKDYPEVEHSIRFQDLFRGISVKTGDLSFYEYGVVRADADVFKVFDLPFIEGDPDTALTEPNTVVITESIARKYFRDRKAGDKIINFGGMDFRITGVAADLPSNAHFHFNIFLSMITWEERLKNTNWFANNYKTYILLKEGTSWREFEAKFPGLVRNYLAEGFDLDAWMAQGNYWEYYLQPLTSIHLNSDLNGEFEANGNDAYVSVSFLIALFILLIAAVNYMNLATARSAGRAREVGIRKVAGSSRGPLLRQFLAESLTASLLALILAVILIEALLPAFRGLTGRPLSMPYLEDPVLIPVLLGLGLALGLFSGAYPAFFLASVSPIKVLRGRLMSASRNSGLRNLLVLVQFSISIFLVVGTLVVHRQTNFMRNKKLGFNKDRVVIIHTPTPLGDRSQAFKERLAQLPGIVKVSGSHTIPGQQFNNRGFRVEGLDESITLNLCAADYDFLETMGMEMKSGRYFSREFMTDNAALVLNEAAVELIGWEDPIGKKLSAGANQNFIAIGVVKDFHYESLHHSVRPGALVMIPGLMGHQENFISVRIETGNVNQILDSLRGVWQEFSAGLPFEYSFLDADFDSLYHNEQRTGRIFTVFSCLAIGIACLGLLGLAAFAAEQKTREIGIRKVLGASVPGIILLMSKELTRWVVLANLVAWPAAFFALSRWLQNFAYRAALSWFYFILAGVITLVIAWTSVGIQAFKAAAADPVVALKYE